MKPKSKFPLLVAEVANCHGGSKAYLTSLVKDLGKTTIPVIKFQLIRVDELLTPWHDQYDLFTALEFDDAFWQDIVCTIKGNGQKVACDIFGEQSLALAKKLKADFLKIYASDIDDLVFVKKVLALGKPVFLSTGGATQEELDRLMKVCRGKDVCLLVGFQSFPTPINEAHLNRIDLLRKRYDCPVGFMDHTAVDDIFSWILPCQAVAKGAVTIEKHVHLQGRKTKYDWQSAFSVKDLKCLQKLLKQSLLACGEQEINRTSLEQRYFDQKRKVAVAASDLPQGKRITANDVLFRWVNKRKGKTYITRQEMSSYIKRKIKRNIQQYQELTGNLFQ